MGSKQLDFVDFLVFPHWCRGEYSPVVFPHPKQKWGKSYLNVYEMQETGTGPGG